MFRRSNTTRQDDVVDDRSTCAHTVDDSDRGTSGDRRIDPAPAQAARRDRFGGMNLGAAFFGWLVAIAVSILLTSIVGAIVAAAGSNAQVTQSQAQKQAGTIGIVADIVLLVVLMIGYYCGGYVAGGVSRFSRTKPGPRRLVIRLGV